MLSYRLGTVNDFHWGFKPVLSYSKPHTFSASLGEEKERKNAFNLSNQERFNLSNQSLQLTQKPLCIVEISRWQKSKLKICRFFISNNYYIYLKRYFEKCVTNDFLSIFWRTAALNDLLFAIDSVNNDLQVNIIAYFLAHK